MAARHYTEQELAAREAIKDIVLEHSSHLDNQSANVLAEVILVGLLRMGYNLSR